MAGVLIKAEALAAWGRVEKLWRLCNVEGTEWGAQIAASVLRQAAAA